MLFEDQVQRDVQRAVALVEQALRARGKIPERCSVESAAGSFCFALDAGRSENGCREIELEVIITVSHPALDPAPSTERSTGQIRVTSVVSSLPEEPEELCRYLLERNADSAMGAAFGIVDREIVLLSERSVEDLDPSEVDAILQSVERHALDYAKKLSTLFGSKKREGGSPSNGSSPKA
ncbi:MAG: YbjN domain-containing protein [Myxococcota bacterium]